MKINEMHKRLETISWEMMAAQYRSDYKILLKLENERKELKRKLDEFYNDSMTKACGF